MLWNRLFANKDQSFVVQEGNYCVMQNKMVLKKGNQLKDFSVLKTYPGPKWRFCSQINHSYSLNLKENYKKI